MNHLPQPVKYSADGAAVVVAWTHFFGKFWETNVGTIAASLSAVWLVLQIGGWIYDKFKKG